MQSIHPVFRLLQDLVKHQAVSFAFLVNIKFLNIERTNYVLSIKFATIGKVRSNETSYSRSLENTSTNKSDNHRALKPYHCLIQRLETMLSCVTSDSFPWHLIRIFSQLH